MTPLKQIDFVFFYLKEKIQVGGSWGYQNIWSYVERTPETGITTPSLLRDILNRLVDDDFITETILPESQPVYRLTFKGALFVGYNKTEFNEKVKNILYIVSLVAIIIAGIYYALEIYKYLAPLSC